MNHEACIQACYACAAECNRCAAACLQEDDVQMMARCIALDLDCAQMCVVAAAAMARGSESTRDICTVCAQVCEACADECSRHEVEHCRRCAAACRRCADECRRTAAAA